MNSSWMGLIKSHDLADWGGPLMMGCKDTAYIKYTMQARDGTSKRGKYRGFFEKNFTLWMFCLVRLPIYPLCLFW